LYSIQQRNNKPKSRWTKSFLSLREVFTARGNVFIKQSYKTAQKQENKTVSEEKSNHKNTDFQANIQVQKTEKSAVKQTQKTKKSPFLGLGAWLFWLVLLVVEYIVYRKIKHKLF